MAAVLVAIGVLVAVEVAGVLSKRTDDTISELWWNIRWRVGGNWRLLLDAGLLAGLAWAWVHLTFGI